MTDSLFDRRRLLKGAAAGGAALAFPALLRAQSDRHIVLG
ncbi:twin-arginine translocation signal domain-containing protein, partial [Caldimonas tepidiphila]